MFREVIEYFGRLASHKGKSRRSGCSGRNNGPRASRAKPETRVEFRAAPFGLT
jgi:hypothetical protein